MATDEDEPARPIPTQHDFAGEVLSQGWLGLKAKEYAAIHLRVPDSGTDWLDAMIRRSNRNIARLAHSVASSVAKAMEANK